MTFTVYKITNRINDKIYIGITKHTIEKRIKEHINGAKYDLEKDRKIFQAIRKYGEENFIIEAICSTWSKKNLLELETHFIKECDSFRNGYNMNEGGTGLLYHSEETKKKMSERNYWRGKPRNGELNPMFGKKHSEEVRKKQSEKKRENNTLHGHKGHYSPHTEETKRKISEAKKGTESWNKGKQFDEKTRKKMSEAALHRDPSTRSYKTYEVSFPDGHTEIVSNMVEFCEKHSLNVKVMRFIAQGRTKKPHKGFSCKVTK